jgi:hypothetical protein
VGTFGAEDSKDDALYRVEEKQGGGIIFQHSKVALSKIMEAKLSGVVYS